VALLVKGALQQIYAALMQGLGQVQAIFILNAAHDGNDLVFQNLLNDLLSHLIAPPR